jgi:hypothetical protein
MSMLLASTEALSQTSEDYALMGKTAWSAFQCSTLVDKREKAVERQRLFNLGYERGKAFIEAWQAGKIEGEHVSRHVPIDVLEKLKPWVNPELPTVDFRLGAIWESAARSVLELIEQSDAPALLAMAEYNQRNCSLLATAKRERR